MVLLREADTEHLTGSAMIHCFDEHLEALGQTHHGGMQAASQIACDMKGVIDKMKQD